jgi:hypothetical protein
MVTPRNKNDNSNMECIVRIARIKVNKIPLTHAANPELTSVAKYRCLAVAFYAAYFDSGNVIE